MPAKISTGTPIHNYESVRQIRQSYETAALYAFALVWIILLLDFLGREARWLSLLPTLLVGVLAAALDAHLPLAMALRRASIAAALSCLVPGAQPSMPTRAAIDAAMADAAPAR